MNALSLLATALSPSGLNLLGVADPAAWDKTAAPSRTAAALYQGTRAIILVGNGGPSMWRAFVRDIEANPGHLTAEANPFDAFARRAIFEADGALGDAPRRWFWAAADAETHIDFRILARLAGFGQASRLGLLLHDTFGPWLGLRAACFVALDLPFATLDSGLDPGPQPGGGAVAEPLSHHCEGCSRCVAACPGAALPGGRWAVDVCSTYHHTSTRCASSCSSRSACPVGAAHRYDDAEITYHYNRALGRQALRARLGVSAPGGDGGGGGGGRSAGSSAGDPAVDGFDGIGPHWTDWRTRVDVAGG
ncbi:MAG: hypothetical protein EXR69_07080 [Myxococcales bacterium]|nr:hypothetical protein [Myxococcales bacterium]